MGHVTHLKILNPFNISGTDEATILKFGKRIDYGKTHPEGEKFTPERGVVWVTLSFLV